jgi:endonuclease/exonuclease/phosphatase family metal-dependent hydrolase
MKKIFIVLLLVISIMTDAQELNVMTFNIRLNTTSDSLNAWLYRKDKVASQVLFHQTHILGVQEALPDQVKDLQQSLSQYKFTGVGRDDGKNKGEYSAIFIDTTRLKLMESSTFWLSLTPDIPGSKNWDAAITRIVTWAKLYDKKSHKTFFVFNTHFDHIGKEARRESAKLILQQVMKIAGKMNVIIMGDFNSKPDEDPYKVLTDKANINSFVDSKDISKTLHYGPTGTFNAFKSKEIDDKPIDYIFLRGKWKVLQHATLSQTWGGRFSSDHFPVFAKLNF